MQSIKLKHYLAKYGDFICYMDKKLFTTDEIAQFYFCAPYIVLDRKSQLNVQYKARDMEKNRVISRVNNTKTWKLVIYRPNTIASSKLYEHFKKHYGDSIISTG